MTKLFHKSSLPNYKAVCRLGQVGVLVPRSPLTLDCHSLITLTGGHNHIKIISASRKMQTRSINHQFSTFQTALNTHCCSNCHTTNLNAVVYCMMQCRQKSEDVKGKAIVEKKESPYAGLTAAEKVKEAGKDVTYTGIVIVGIAVTGLIFYYIGRELLSSQSPSGVHTKAYKLCQHNTEVEAAFGRPLKTYGETTRRGRRRHVSHVEFEERGVKHMRMKFYIEGPYKKGTVRLQAKQNESGKYEFVYLIVEVDTYPSRTIVIEDKR